MTCRYNNRKNADIFGTAIAVRYALFGFALLIATSCDSWGQSQEQPPVKEPQTQATQNQPGAEQRGTEQAPFVVKILPTTKSEEKAPDNAQSHDDKSGTDGQLVVATWTLAALALPQFGALCFQAFYLARTITHNRRIERAHVSGGANRGRKSDGSEVLIVTINNYGKTQATIGTVAATICKEEELDAFPGWGVNQWTDHVFVKEWKGYVFWQIGGQQIDVVLPFQTDSVIAGRIWYSDIFKKRYSVGFLLKTDDLTAIGRKSFWEEREEKDPSE
jgi:hypothetical protein